MKSKRKLFFPWSSDSDGGHPYRPSICGGGSSYGRGEVSGNRFRAWVPIPIWSGSTP